MTVTPLRPRPTRTAISPQPATPQRKRGPVVVAAPPVPAKRRSSSQQEVEQHLAAAAALQAQIQSLETELLAHRQWLLRHLTATGERTVTLGTFSAHLRSRSNWTYSTKLENELLRLRGEQTREQRAGIAFNSPTPYVALVFKPAAS